MWIVAGAVEHLMSREMGGFWGTNTPPRAAWSHSPICHAERGAGVWHRGDGGAVAGRLEEEEGGRLRG